MKRVDPAMELERVEPGCAHHRRAGRQRGEQPGHDAVDVEQRHHVERTVGRGELQGRRDVPCGPGQVALAQWHDLGSRCRARGVQHQRLVVGGRALVRRLGDRGCCRRGDEIDRQALHRGRRWRSCPSGAAACAAGCRPVDGERARRRGGRRGRSGTRPRGTSGSTAQRSRPTSPPAAPSAISGPLGSTIAIRSLARSPSTHATASARRSTSRAQRGVIHAPRRRPSRVRARLRRVATARPRCRASAAESRVVLLSAIGANSPIQRYLRFRVTIAQPGLRAPTC